MIENIYKYGNQLEIGGMIMQNGEDGVLLFFPESSILKHYEHLRPSHEDMKDILYQLDTLGVESLQKTILRKSQRQIEANISWNVFRRDGFRCRYCGNDKVPLTVDHIVLWEHMGASVEDNLISACRKCNKTRGNMLYPDWLKTDYYDFAMRHTPDVRERNRVQLLNEQAWDIAEKLPLRASNRNR